MSYHPSRELLTLLNAHCNGQLDAVQGARLETLLGEDEQAIVFYLRYVWLESELGLEGAALDADATAEQLLAPSFAPSFAPPLAPPTARPTASPTALPVEPRRRRSPLWSGLVRQAGTMLDWRHHPVRFAVLALVLTGYVWIWFFSIFAAGRHAQSPGAVARSNSPAAASSPAASAPAVHAARLTGGHQTVWSDPNAAPFAGAHLAEGRPLSLRSGLAEITFESGARVILQGPAEFRIDSPLSASLERGRLFAHAPASARSFAIATPTLIVHDLGTEFAVEVDRAQNVDVCVFEGAVELRPHRPAAWPVQQLHTGDARRLSARGAWTASPHRAARYARSLPAGRKGLLLHWKFDAVQAGDPPATHDASGWGRSGVLRDAVQSTPVAGRRGGGLQFDGALGRVELLKSFDDEFERAFEACTLALWVQPTNVDELRWIAGKMGRPGERGWQLAQAADGRIEWVGFDGADGKTQRLSSDAPALAPEKFAHVAVVFQGGAFLRLYVDGRLAAEQASPRHVVLERINSANAALLQIGNRGDNSRSSFHGAIDDVRFYDRALTVEEIAALCEPPQLSTHSD